MVASKACVRAGNVTLNVDHKDLISHHVVVLLYSGRHVWTRAACVTAARLAPSQVLQQHQAHLLA
jgi:hypothetical protein